MEPTGPDREVIPPINDSKSFVFSSSLEGLESIMGEILSFFGQPGGLSQELLFSAELILREALVNAIVHGNRSQNEKKVFLGLKMDSSGLYMNITDEGEGFHWKSAMAHSYPSGEQEHGRGLLLMRDYGYTTAWNDRGNQLSLFHARQGRSTSK